MSQNPLSLKVLEAYTRDVGRGVARIDYDSMDNLGASTGDVIEIKGKRRTVAKCLPLYPSDEGKGIIRIDGLGRNNSGIAIGDAISVKKIKAVQAEKIIVAPLEAIPPIDERYLADALESVPLIKGDNVMVPYFGGKWRKFRSQREKISNCQRCCPGCIRSPTRWWTTPTRWTKLYSIT